MKMFTLVIKNGKPFGRELNPYGFLMPELSINLQTFRTHGDFQQDIWKQAENNLKEFEIDESQDYLWMVEINEKSMKFGVNSLNVGDTFKAKLKGNKLFDLTL